MRDWNKSQVFLCFILSFVAGVFMGSFYFLPTLFLKIVTIFLFIILIVFWEKKTLKIIILSCLFFFWGFQKINQEIFNIPQRIENKNFKGEVLISSEPKKKNDYKEVRVKSKDFGKIIFYTDTFSDLEYGDILDLECQLEVPQNKDQKFDYQKYLAKDKIYYICKKSKWEKTGENKNFFWQNIFKFKNKIEEIIQKNIPFPESSLLSGLLLGKDSSFPEKLKNDFSRTGLTHIVAVSGFNITIIANYLMLLGILLGLWRKQAFYLAVLGIIFFVVLIGFPASAARAAVMGVLVLWAMKNGRLSNSENALTLAAAIMLFKNPMLLRWDIGFQLSFLATLGIIYFYPILENFLLKKDKKLGFVSETVFLTLSAQVFVLPIILYNFGNLSLVSLLANLLVLPIVPLAMLLGFLMIVFSWVPIISIIFSWIVFLFLVYETKMASLLAKIPFASLEISFPAWGVIIWYIVLIGFIFAKKKTAGG